MAIFPRAMNNAEKTGLKIVKESGLSYEVKFNKDSFVVDVPELRGTYFLCQIEHFESDYKLYKKEK